MRSNFFGKAKGNERGDAGLSSSSSSTQSSPSRKGKKSTSDKPKQPQRGLGVAQLERIRLHNQLGRNYVPSAHNPYIPNLNQEDIRAQTAYSSSSFSYSSSSSYSNYGFQGSHGVMMGLQDFGRANIRYGESEPTNAVRWHPGGNTGFEIYQYVEPSMTKSFLGPGVEDSLNNENKRDQNDSMSFIGQDSESSSSQEIDLELRLSL